jgi:hypothetical protein
LIPLFITVTDKLPPEYGRTMESFPHSFKLLDLQEIEIAIAANETMVF